MFHETRVSGGETAYDPSMQPEKGRTLRRRALSRHDEGFSPDQLWPDQYGGDARDAWSDVFRIVRAETERRAAPLSPEDQVIQSMPDASPIKWHRAHTTWFFEQFVVAPNVPSYQGYDPRFAFLFNSYYVAAGPRYARPKRGLVTRPDAADVARYRGHVDGVMECLLADAAPDVVDRVVPLV